MVLSVAPRVSFRTLGCKVNAYDTAAMAERLRTAGCEIVPPEAAADVVIVNTCTVTDTADAESRRLARRVRRLNPAARLIVTGCYAQTKPDEVADLEAVDHVIGTNRLEDLVRAALGTEAGLPRVVVEDVRRARSVRTVGARRFDGHTRAFLKVQEGCDLFCTFCIVPMARGRSRSLAPRQVLREMESLAAAGFAEVVLTGVHLGGYGQDLEPRMNLAGLLEALVEQGLFRRIRLSSVDPHEVTERLLAVMAASEDVCPHLHVPLQAGDDATLRRMRRRYDAALAAERLAMIAERLPDVSIGTDLIAGFPGEDEAAFERTLRFVEAAPLAYAHVFPYSVRSGTTAAKLPDQVSRATIRRRARCLREVTSRKAVAHRRRFDGTRAEVLVEATRDPGSGCLRGYTRNYLRARLEGPDGLKGRPVAAALRVGTDGDVRAEPAE
jgi:threonylcarbamoyladenosine tRNA methylthiotransferase MtaB